MCSMVNESPFRVWERFDPRHTLGGHILVYDEVDSTMDVAWALMDKGYRHGTVVRAAAQRMGRGRFARRWVTGHDESLLLSVVVRNPPTRFDAPLMIASTLAVANTVTTITGVNCGIKWPNDVEINGKKIAGILIETRVTVDRRAQWVLGIGVNVNLDPSTVPSLHHIATSMMVAAGGTVSLEYVQSTLLENLEHQFNEMDSNSLAPLKQWKALLTTIGKEITVHGREGTLSGIAVDVDHNGHLLLRTRNNMVHVLPEGDVTLRSY